MKILPYLLLTAPVLCAAQATSPAKTPAPVSSSVANQAANQAQAPAPIITFEKTHHDFGKIYPDHKVAIRFKVTNTGNATLNITKLNPSCGCTSTVLGKWSLEPSESTEVEASFDPHGFKGAVHKSINVVSNDPVHGNMSLTFEGQVIQDVMPSTTSVFFSDVQRDAAAKKTEIRLASGNEVPVHVKEVKAPGAPYLSTSFKSEGNDVILAIELNAKKIPVGKMQGADKLTVTTTSERDPNLTITVQWEVKATVIASPDKVMWTETSGNELKTQVSLKQIDGKPFKVLSAKCTNPVLRVEGMKKPKATQQDLQVIMSSSAKAGRYNENVVLTLDDPNQSEITIRVVADLK